MPDECAKVCVTPGRWEHALAQHESSPARVSRRTALATVLVAPLTALAACDRKPSQKSTVASGPTTTAHSPGSSGSFTSPPGDPDPGASDGGGHGGEVGVFGPIPSGIAVGEQNPSVPDQPQTVTDAPLAGSATVGQFIATALALVQKELTSHGSGTMTGEILSFVHPSTGQEHSVAVTVPVKIDKRLATTVTLTADASGTVTRALISPPRTPDQSGGASDGNVVGCWNSDENPTGRPAWSTAKDHLPAALKTPAPVYAVE